MKFRKKPVMVEAEQYLGPTSIPSPGPMPTTPAGVVWRVFDSTGDRYPCIETLEGRMVVSPGDWVITGVKGERYPCKPDIFAATYEPVKEGSDG